MTKNLYYRAVLHRRNIIGEIFFNFFLAICSYPRLVIEVFIRRDMGERYFTLASAITVGVILAVIPFLSPATSYLPAEYILMGNMLWYVFLAAYAFFAFLRYRETLRNPSVFNFGSYSKKDGELLPVFKRTRFNIRQIEIYIEPLPVLLLGLLLLAIEQHLPGLLFTFCAIVYSISKAAAYWQGDQFIMDKIDEFLCHEDLRDDFLHKGQPQSRHGFKFRHHIPFDPAMRESLYKSFFEAEDAPLAY